MEFYHHAIGDNKICPITELCGDPVLRSELYQLYRFQEGNQSSNPRTDSCAGILEQSMGARNRVGIRLLYRPAKLHRLAESIPGGPLKFKNTSTDVLWHVAAL
jgi:hypothetical protein